MLSKTTISVVNNENNEKKRVANTIINYGLHFEELKQQIGLAIRLAPDECYYHVDKIMVGKKELCEGSNVNELVDSLHHLTVYVSIDHDKPVGVPVRAATPSKHRSGTPTRNVTPGRAGTPTRSMTPSKMALSSTPLKIESDNNLTNPEKENKFNVSKSPAARNINASPMKLRLSQHSSTTPRKFQSPAKVRPLTKPTTEKKLRVINAEVHESIETKKLFTTIDNNEVISTDAVSNDVEAIDDTWKDVFSPIKDTEDVTVVQSESGASQVELVQQIATNESTDSVTEIAIVDDTNGVIKEETVEVTPIDAPVEVVQTTEQVVASDEPTRAANTSVVTEKKAYQPAKAKTGSLFPNGKTGGETKSFFDNNLRATIKASVVPNKPPQQRTKTPTRIAASTSSAKRSMSKIDAALLASRDDNDGRPSFHTMEQQWSFMREQFINNSTDELEWLMISKTLKQSYDYAHKKYEETETRYMKLLYDISRMERKLEYLTATVHSDRHIPTIIAGIVTDCENCISSSDNETDYSRFMNEKLIKQTKLRSIIDEEQTIVSYFSAETMKSIKSITEKGISPKRVLSIASTLVETTFPTMIKNTEMALLNTRKKSEDASEDMEKWSKREKQAPDYAKKIQEQEAIWLDKELQNNTEALKLMRSIIPTNIAELSLQDLLSQVSQNGGSYSLELANELRNNALLHWLVTDTEDIKSSNFLQGDKKQYFESLENLDVVEIRALCAVLPKKFDLDNDGKKKDWRDRFVSKAKIMIAQSNGDTVAAGWNPVLKKRDMKQLPDLKMEQKRRSVYFYKKHADCLAKLRTYSSKHESLQKKQLQLIQCEDRYRTAKEEFEITLKECRDPLVKAAFASSADVANKLTHAKEMAKKELNEVDSALKTVKREIDGLNRVIAAFPITKENFEGYLASLGTFILGKYGVDYANTDNILPIEGVFDSNPIIMRAIRTSNDDQAETPAADASSESTRVDSIKEMFESKDATETVAYVDCSEKNSVQSRLNPEMLSQLNKVYSPLPAKGKAIASSKAVRCNETAAVTHPTKSLEELQIKSKFIQELLHSSTPEAIESAHVKAAPLSFLDAIKQRGLK